MSFTNKIKNYTNETSSENVTDALTKGVDYTLSCIKKYNPVMLSQFATSLDNGNVVFSDVFTTFHIFELLSVDRKQGAVSYWGRPIDEKMMQKAKDTKSIYFATYHDPVYTIKSNGTLEVFPIETSANLATLFFVRHSEGKTVDDANETLKDNEITFGGNTIASSEHFPNWAKELVILHASECILMERLVDFRTNIPTALDAEWADALAKAKKLFDDGAQIGGDNAGASMSVQYWLSDEDEDMTATTIQAIQSEVGRANAYVQKFKTDLEIVATDYQWTQGQLQMLGAKKQEFIQHQLQSGVSDTVNEGKAIG